MWVIYQYNHTVMWTIGHSCGDDPLCYGFIYEWISVQWSIFITWSILPQYYIDGWVQDCSNSFVNALELLQSCIKPLIYRMTMTSELYRSSYDLTENTLYLALLDELWNVFCEYFREKWSYQQGVWLYLTVMEKLRFIYDVLDLYLWHHLNGLVQERRESIANAQELRLSCTNASIYCYLVGRVREMQLSCWWARLSVSFTQV